MSRWDAGDEGLPSISRSLPPLDLHAHIATDIQPRELEGLGAVVFTITRSLDEYEVIRRRSDAVTVWGVGCHPGLVTAQKRFDADRFADVIQHAAFVGEVGLDGSSKVPMGLQEEVLASVLDTVASTPRLTSVHSYRATKGVLDIIEQTGTRGVILHWWLGSEAETKRAIALGCLFSINQSMNLGKLKTAGVPITSLLPETDHPSGNRRASIPRQPGQTLDVERAVAASYDVPASEVRTQFWRTLAEVSSKNETFGLLPPVVQAILRQAQAS